MKNDPPRSVHHIQRALLSATLGAMGCSSAPFVPETPPLPVGRSLLRDATYFAFLQPMSARAGFGGAIGPVIVHEGGRDQCAALSEALTQRGNEGQPIEDGPMPSVEGCSPEAVSMLMKHVSVRERTVVALTPRGEEVIRRADLDPIETPDEALLAVWFSSQYDLTFPTAEQQSLGSLEAAYARPLPTGFEVIASEERRGDRIGGDDRELTGECPRYVREHYRVVLEVGRDGSMRLASKKLVRESEEYVECRPLGRRPQTFVDHAPGPGLRDHLARAMHHEAESVRAFLRLARELEAYGAPEAWVARARSAAEEERRHAEMVGSLARALGGWVLRPQVATDELPVRHLEAIATENAVEGCVLEAFAAMVAQHQCLRATDPRVRHHFATIADDELGHAALALACHDFFVEQLDPDARDRVRDARARACADLRDDVANGPPHRPLGIPGAVVATRFADTLFAMIEQPAGL